MKQSSKARLFVAIEVPLKIRQELIQIQNAIRSSGCCLGTYPSSAMMHATIQFLGWHDTSHTDAIVSTLQSIKAASFTITFDAIDVFKKHGHPAVIYAKSTSPELAMLAQHISQAAAPFNEPDNKPFVGHLTLMRIKAIENEQLFYELLASLSIPPLTWKIDSFSLMESKIENGQRTYQELARFPLT